MNERWFLRTNAIIFQYRLLRHLLAHDIGMHVCWMLTGRNRTSKPA